MKIVIFDGSFKTTTFINRLIKGLASNGVSLYVLGFNEEIKHKIEGVNYVGLGSNQSFYSFIKTSLVLGFSSSFQKGFNALFNILNKDRKKLQKQNLDLVLQQIQPDIIHVQWPSLLHWVEPHFITKRYKIVLSERGNQINVQPFVDATNFAYLQKCYPHIDGFHSVSKAISEVSNTIYNHSPKKVEVVYTGLDLKKFKFNSEVKRNSKLKIISVGRHHWVKGYDVALKAMQQFKKDKVDFEYTIVGAKGDEELVFLRHDLGLEKEVAFLDKLPQKQVFDLMNSSDLFLLPSVEEGIANVVVEAMALGTPVISTDCGGMQELITHEKEGWIVPIRNPEAIAQQIQRFTATSEDELKTIKWAARKKVENQHTEEKMVEGMLELYRSVLNMETVHPREISTIEVNQKLKSQLHFLSNTTIKTPIIPTRQSFVKIKNQPEELDYKAICLFVATGFFWDDSTYWKNQKVLRPGSLNTVDKEGYLVNSKPWFQWQYEPKNQSFETSLQQYQELFEQIIDEQIGNQQVILPLSGGLDSRSQAVALHKLGKEVTSYSYSFQDGYKEHEIAKQVAKACNFKFKAFEIPSGYLWNRMDELANINQCYSEFTHPRQMAVLDDLKRMNGTFSLGHWGDVLFDKGAENNINDQDLVPYIQEKVVKKGGLEFAKKLWKYWEQEGDFETYLNDTTQSLLNKIDIENTSAKVRAFKSMFWAPRWTSINLSIFEAAHPITLPYYDDRMCQLITKIPEEHLANRKLQIAYILKNNPSLAKIMWQDQRPYNLTNFQKNKAPKNLPYRISDKLNRLVNEKRGIKFIQRNWELQFLGKENDTQLKKHLMNSDFQQFIDADIIQEFYTHFQTKNQVAYSHPVSMLLTLSVWWRKFGEN